MIDVVMYLVSALLGLAPSVLAIMILYGIVFWVAGELSTISVAENFFAKLKHLGRAVLIALTGSYFGGLYINGIAAFPAGLASIFIMFVIALTSLIFLTVFFYPGSRRDPSLGPPP